MDDFIERAIYIAKQYEMGNLEKKLRNITMPENAPYLKVAIVSSLNRLPNLIMGEDVLPDKLMIKDQELICITFDGSDDENFKTLHVQNERWGSIPIRFYVITWDRAFHDDASPCKALEEMDAVIFGMDVAAAFSRSMIDGIAATLAWDVMIVIEGLEKIPEEESDEFIRVCLKRTENLNMCSQQLIFWDSRVSYIAYEQIASKLLLRWKNDKNGQHGLAEYRRDKFEANCKKWVSNEMKAALLLKINETREVMNRAREKLQVNRQLQERCQQADVEMEHWISEFERELRRDMDHLRISIKEKNGQCLDCIPITQNTINTVVENTKEQWKNFVDSQYKIMEISLLSKIKEIRMKYSMPENMDVNSFDKTAGEAAVSAPGGIWYHPVLLAGVGAASLLCTGFGITILLAFPVLKIKQMHDKNEIMKKLEESNARIAEEMEGAFHKDLESCKGNVAAAFEQELLTGMEIDVKNVHQLSDTMRQLCDLLDEYRAA